MFYNPLEYEIDYDGVYKLLLAVIRWAEYDERRGYISHCDIGDV